MNNFSLIASGTVRSEISFEPLVTLSQWWHLILFAITAGCAICFVLLVTIRDRKDQPWAVVAGLVVLRLLLIGILLVAIGNLKRKQENVVVAPSTLAVIIDNSQSMNLNAQAGSDEFRFDLAKQQIANTDWSSFTANHQVVFYSLGEASELNEIARLDWVPPETDEPSEKSAVSTDFGWWFFALSLLLLATGLYWGQEKQTRGLLQLTGIITLVFSSLWLSLAFIGDEARTWGQPNSSLQITARTSTHDSTNNLQNLEEKLAVLRCELPTTPLIDSINKLVNGEEGKTLAGIFLFSDGNDSSGDNLTMLGINANDSSVPVVPIGFGTLASAENIHVSDLAAEKKVYLGNPFSVSGSVNASSKTFPLSVELEFSSIQTEGTSATESMSRKIESKVIHFQEPGSIPFEFNLTEKKAGNYRYSVSATPLENESDYEDNLSTVDVEVVDRKAKVLLFAGGPNREFRFLRNQLFRDPSVELNVYLQSADQGAFQEGDELLEEFPAESKLFNEYDCVVAFDPAWDLLTVDQTEMVRKWVAEESGGLVVVAGPVNTPGWTSRAQNDPVVSPIRKLYPVTFFGQVNGAIRLGRSGGDEAFPLTFTRASAAYDFLKFDNDPKENKRLWDQVELFGFYAVNDEKAGADVIALFSDPLTRQGGKQPIYLASQLYGNGRVFFQASSELWRTRGVGPEFFEQYYSRLIRWTSQGRLFRDDKTLSLIVDKPKCLVGDVVTLRAMVNKRTPEFEAIPALDVSHFHQTGEFPDGLKLKRIDNVGESLSFETRFRVSVPGRHHFKTIVAVGDKQEIIETELIANIPNLELARTSRNDEGLKILAEVSGGKYYLSNETSGRQWIAESRNFFGDHSVETASPMGHDRSFARKLQFCLFACFALFLTANWLIRRLNRLA